MDFEAFNTQMGHNGPFFELIYHDHAIYDGWIDSRSTIVHKGVLVIRQGCIGDSEQVLWIGLIDKLNDPMWLINQLEPTLD